MSEEASEQQIPSLLSVRTPLPGDTVQAQMQLCYGVPVFIVDDGEKGELVSTELRESLGARVRIELAWGAGGEVLRAGSLYL